jgi:hypothetical protein
MDCTTDVSDGIDDNDRWDEMGWDEFIIGDNNIEML